MPTKQDKRDAKRRVKLAKKTRRELAVQHKVLLTDNFARLRAVTDEEWAEAVGNEPEEL